MPDLLQTERISVESRGSAHVIDVTSQVTDLVERTGLAEGMVLVFVSGSTAAVTTIEYEPGLLRDLPELFDGLIPSGRRYHHDDTWHDGNGHSHLQATLMGPSLTVPVSDGKLVLGTWQQIFHLECDIKPRNREIIVTVTGE